MEPYFKIRARSEQQLKWDLHITRLICQGSLPFAFVQSDAWKDFHNCPELRKYHIKNPTTYSKAKLPLLYKQVHAAIQNKIKKDIPGTKGFAFTADMWTARNFEPFLGLTGHYITKNWKMEKLLVYCGPARGRHTAPLIGAKLDKVINDMELPDDLFKAITTDNAANMLAATTRNSDVLQKGLGCVDHLLQIVINSSIKNIFIPKTGEFHRF